MSQQLSSDQLRRVVFVDNVEVNAFEGPTRTANIRQFIKTNLKANVVTSLARKVY